LQHLDALAIQSNVTFKHCLHSYLCLALFKSCEL